MRLTFTTRCSRLLPRRSRRPTALSFAVTARLDPAATSTRALPTTVTTVRVLPPRRIFRLLVNSTRTPQLAFLQANPNETARPGSARSFDTTPVAAGFGPAVAPGPAPAGLSAPAESVGCADDPPGWSLPVGAGELEVGDGEL